MQIAVGVKKVPFTILNFVTKVPISKYSSI